MPNWQIDKHVTHYCILYVCTVIQMPKLRNLRLHTNKRFSLKYVPFCHVVNMVFPLLAVFKKCSEFCEWCRDDACGPLMNSWECSVSLAKFSPMISMWLTLTEEKIKHSAKKRAFSYILHLQSSAIGKNLKHRVFFEKCAFSWQTCFTHSTYLNSQNNGLTNIKFIR